MSIALHCKRAVLAASILLSTTVSGITAAEPIASARIDAIKAELKQRVDNGELAGVVAMVAKDGVVQMKESYGYRDLENNVAMTDDSLFRIFSMTKPIAGTALMMLYDEGKFKLDDPVEKYIPELKGLEVYTGVADDGSFTTEPAEHPTTIRELMSHTGGYAYFPPLSRGPVPSAYAKANILGRDTTLADMADKLSSIPLNHQPGSRWMYSISVDIQGYLVEVLSGKPFDEFLQERLFAPLGMKDTSFQVPTEKANRLVRRYRPGKDGKLASPENSTYLKPTTFFSGGGGLISTAEDYMHFALMHVNKGVYNGKRILSEDAIDIMRSNQLPDSIANIGPGYPGNQFGVDFAIVNDPAKADGMPVGTHWWWGIAGSWFWIDPVENIVFVGMINHDDLRYARGLHSKTRQLIYRPL
ncbi:serine hydrolase domain-containing protein [Aurantivibrio plasticivorans]